MPTALIKREEDFEGGGGWEGKEEEKGIREVGEGGKRGFMIFRFGSGS